LIWRYFHLDSIGLKLRKLFSFCFIVVRFQILALTLLVVLLNACVSEQFHIAPPY
jgi:short subunit fatty acids transporter